MAVVPAWPFRCPYEGWYLSNVEAQFVENPQSTVPSLVTGTCKKHGYVEVTNPVCYDPDLWRSNAD